MLVTGSGQTPEVIDTDPGVRRILFGIALPLAVRPRDREQLLGVRPRPLPELAREARQPALVLHVQQQLRRAVRVGGDDHLLGGVGVMVQMRGSLRPAGMTRVHLEPASVERDEVVDLVQLVDLGAELLRQVEVVRRQLVLGVVAAADVALAARDAAGAPRSDPAEVRIVGLDARAAEVDADRGLVERLPSPHLDRDLLHDAIDVGGHVRVANDAEHPRRLVEVRRQLVGPVGDARPLRRVEELLRRDVQRVGVDVRSAADAGAGEDEHVIEVLDPLDPVQLRRGEPQEVRQMPLALRDVLVLPALAGLHDADPVALLRGTERGDASTEPRADDHHVVVEARHHPRRLVLQGPRCVAPGNTLNSSRGVPRGLAVDQPLVRLAVPRAPGPRAVPRRSRGGRRPSARRPRPRGSPRAGALLVVPGIGTIHGLCASSQASATCAGRCVLALGDALQQVDEAPGWPCRASGREARHGVAEVAARRTRCSRRSRPSGSPCRAG